MSSHENGQAHAACTAVANPVDDDGGYRASACWIGFTKPWEEWTDGRKEVYKIGILVNQMTMEVINRVAVYMNLMVYGMMLDVIHCILVYVRILGE
eukprot:502827_1